MLIKDNYLYKSAGAFAAVSVISIAAGNILLGIMLLLFIIDMRRKTFALDENYKNYFVFYGIFLLTMLISALFSGDALRGLKVWTNFWLWRFAPFFIIVIGIRSASAAKNILICSAVGIASGIICLLYQGISGDSRAAGFFGHPMTFAGYLCLYLPVLLVGFFDKKIFGHWNWLSGVVFLCGCAALLFNGTRGAWLALTPVIIFILVYYMLQNRKFMLIGLAFLIAASAGLSQNRYFISRLNSVTSTTYQSNTERLLIWSSALQMFKDHPALGVGLGQYKYNYQNKYISPKAKEPNLGHAHNNFMQMLAENGAVGFLGFIFIIGYIVIHNILAFFKTKSPYALIISMSTLALLLQGLTEYNFGNSAVVKFFWLIISCLVVLDNLDFNKYKNKTAGN